MKILITGGLPLDIFIGLLIAIWLWAWLPVVVIRTKRLPRGACGMAFLNLIFVRADISETTTPSFPYVYRHEYGHVRQMRRYSPWVCSLFMGGWYFWHCIIKRKAFWEAWRLNPLERH